MKVFTIKVNYISVRTHLIIAENEENALEKFHNNDYENEHEENIYLDEILSIKEETEE